MRPTGSLGNNFIIFKQERNEREGECSFAFQTRKCFPCHKILTWCYFLESGNRFGVRAQLTVKASVKMGCAAWVWARGLALTLFSVFL